MRALEQEIHNLIGLVKWHPAVPLHVVSQFDAKAYALMSDLNAQAEWVSNAVRSLYVMADWEAGAGPFDEPTAAERARTLLAQIGITGPFNLQEL